MATLPVIDEWNKDPEFQNLLYEVRRQKVLAYFDGYHSDAKFRALLEGRQEEIKGRIAAAYLGEAPALPPIPETTPGPTTGQRRAESPRAFIDGWTQGSLEIPKSVWIGMNYAGHRIKGDGTLVDRYTKNPNAAMRLMTDHQHQRFEQKNPKV